MAFTAAYAVAVARNKIFNIRAAVHDALEIAELAARGATTKFPGLAELQPSPFRFDHRKVKSKERVSKNDQKVAETVRKYTKGAGSGSERDQAVGAGEQERPADREARGGGGSSRETSEAMKGDERDEGYKVYGEGQGDFCKRK